MVKVSSKMLEKAMRKPEKVRRKEKSYKYGRFLLIGLALISIPLDGQKMYEGVDKAKMYLNKSMFDTVQFYSSTLITHVIGAVSAYDHEIWLTVACRLLCTFVYQYELSTRSNDTIPSNPQDMKKMLHEKYPEYIKRDVMNEERRTTNSNLKKKNTKKHWKRKN